MSFHPLVIDSRTYNQTGSGVYTNSTVSFGGLADSFKIAPGREAKGGQVNASISRHVEKNVTINGVPTKRRVSAVLQIQSDVGFTATEIDALIADISTFVVPANLDRILLGES